MSVSSPKEIVESIKQSFNNIQWDIEKLVSIIEAQQERIQELEAEE